MILKVTKYLVQVSANFKTMKNSIIILLIIGYSCVNAQTARISNSDFDGMSLNNKITFYELYNMQEGNWNEITSALGMPSNSEICKVHTIGTDCTFDYNGMRMIYVGPDHKDYHLSRIELTSSSHFISYKGSVIRVGESGSTKLASSFPIAWQQRTISNADPNISIAQLYVGESDTTSFGFQIDNTTGEIVKIFYLDYY